MHIYINKSVLPSLLFGFLFKRRGGGAGMGSKLPRPEYLTPHPFLFREEWLMVDMNIQMTVQKESLYSDKLSFGMESARFSGIVASF